VIQPDDSLLLFEFRDPVAVNDWIAIGDRVMGGTSRSTLRHDPQGHANLQQLHSFVTVEIEERPDVPPRNDQRMPR
jgi:hypothetical protein